MRCAALIGVAVVVLITLAGVALLVAEGLLFDDTPSFNPEWAACGSGDVCVAVSVPCGWTAVNRRHREAAAAYYAYVATVIDLRCRADEVPSEPPPASCRAGRCLLD